MGGAASRAAPSPSRVRPGPAQLSGLRAAFARAARGGGAAAIADLRALPELAGNPLVLRIFAAADADGDGRLTLQEFIRAAGAHKHPELFSTPHSADDYYRLAFSVYDADGDGSISSEELLLMLRGLLGAAFSGQQLERAVRATMEAYDTNGDGRITIDEFKHLVSARDLASKFTFTL
ncbi:MAG: hypothetical protein J3K34DRAFT_510803 [Monoraphidium minutum]|nr:MAG: hypothetical protein J3K34DRAFT_510803 [Monoraphidium minutum]